jgi:hypothetical protein
MKKLTSFASEGNGGLAMRLIDADALKELILKERDAIPKTVVERYSFGAEIPNSHGNSMRGGIRKALRCMEQTPTIDPKSLRPKGRWVHDIYNVFACSECLMRDCMSPKKLKNYCPNCGADMRGEDDARKD